MTPPAEKKKPVSAAYGAHSFFQLPKPQPVASSPQDTFVQWLAEVKQEGQFTLSLTNKELRIAFISPQKSAEETEELLFALDEHLKVLPETQTIKLDDCDLEENVLIVTTKTTLDAKKLNNILQRNYSLAGPPVKPSLALVS
jgi:hypothetical protein